MAIARSEAGVSGGARRDDAESRFIRRAKARLLVRYGKTALDRTAVTKNISESGIFLRTNHPYRPNTSVRLSIQFPDRTFEFWGRVVWAKQVPPQLAHILDCGMGICFTEPSAEWVDFYTVWKKKYGLS